MPQVGPKRYYKIYFLLGGTDKGLPPIRFPDNNPSHHLIQTVQPSRRFIPLISSAAHQIFLNAKFLMEKVLDSPPKVKIQKDDQS